MKKTKVTIEGTIIMIEYCSKKVMEECADENLDPFFDNYYMTNGWQKIESIYVDDNEEVNLVKEKGKFVKVYDYFHKLFAEDGDHPLPVELHARIARGGDRLDYVIELEDDEEFDIKKVQLIKSDLEIFPLPYYILAEKILYDGKEVQVEWEEYADYGIDGKYCNEFEIDKYINRERINVDILESLPDVL